jgi:hypothetical protein
MVKYYLCVAENEKVHKFFSRNILTYCFTDKEAFLHQNNYPK